MAAVASLLPVVTKYIAGSAWSYIFAHWLNLPPSGKLSTKPDDLGEIMLGVAPSVGMKGSV